MKQLMDKYEYIPVLDKEMFFKDFIELVQNAFLESYYHVLSNSYFNEEQVDEVIEKMSQRRPFL